MMEMLPIIFFCLKFMIILNVIGVILSRNPVYSVLFLVLVFVNTAFLFVCLESDFMALVLIVVYVGAIAVLFLFVCMMLNIRIEQPSLAMVPSLPVSLLFAYFLLFELGLLLYDNFVLMAEAPVIEWDKILFKSNHILVFAQIFYTYNVGYFVLAGYILLVAMVGAIFLTLHHRLDVKRQTIFEQISRQISLKKKK